MRPYLEHRRRALHLAVDAIPEPGVEEPGVVNAVLPDGWIERHHLGRVVRRHAHAFLGRQNVELSGVEDELLRLVRTDRIPERGRRVVVDSGEIDQRRVAPRPVGGGPAVPRAVQINGDRESPVDVRRAGIAVAAPHQRFVLMEPFYGRVRRRRHLFLQEPQLVQSHARANRNRERAGHDLHEQGAGVALSHPFELVRIVGDQAGEHVEAAGGALGIGLGADRVGQRQALHERDDEDAALLHDDRLGQVKLGHHVRLDSLGDRAPLAREEARTDAVGDRSEAEVETGRLDLLGCDRRRRADAAGPDELADVL